MKSRNQAVSERQLCCDAGPVYTYAYHLDGPERSHSIFSVPALFVPNVQDK